MPPQSHKIIGKVFDLNTNAPVPNAEVEAWDYDLGVDDTLGSAKTDSDGKFKITFYSKDYFDLGSDPKPDVYFIVHLGDEYLGSTKGAIVWNLNAGITKIEIGVDAPPTEKRVRDVYLKIEVIPDYCPVDPVAELPVGVEYRRDCMRNVGHENGQIPNAEVEARTLDAVIYREYLDSSYLIPKPDKLVEADINEPIFHRRVPGTVIYTSPGEKLRIHVWNCDTAPHSLHSHGLEYGIDSDGAWPFGVASADGLRSDEICPGETWIYTLCATEESIGVWPFHDHWRMAGESIDRGLFGGIVVLPKERGRPTVRVLSRISELVKRVAKAMPKLRRFDPNRPIDPHLRREVGDEIDYLKELLMHKGIEGLEPRARVLHIPLFFHVMRNTSSRPLFNIPDLEEEGGTGEIAFDSVGTFDYLCTIHPQMQGSVIVTPDPPADAAADPVTVHIEDADDVLGLPMGFYPPTVHVYPGRKVKWINNSEKHHTVTSREGAALPTHCFNGRGFVGNSPTIVGYTGQTIRWYVFNLDLGRDFHNFHTHSQRWKFAKENIDTRSLSPAESFQVETKVPPVLLLTDEMKKIQPRGHRPDDARLYTLKGEFLFHCHVHHHMMSGMVGMVRAKQRVWLTPAMVEQIQGEFNLALDDNGNACPEVDLDRCSNKEIGTVELLPIAAEKVFMHAALLPNTDKVLYWGKNEDNKQSRIFDADTGLVSQSANQPSDEDPVNWDLWSAGHAFLDTLEGHLLAHGGFAGSPPVGSFLFDPSTLTWKKTDDTKNGRFYPTTLTLGDGRLLTLYGTGGPDSKTLEIFEAGTPDPETGTWSGEKQFPPEFPYKWYPWTYLLPDGELFVAGPRESSYKFDWTANPVDWTAKKWDTNAGDRGSNMKGTSVMLGLRPPGYAARVLIAGGTGTHNDPALDMGTSVEIIDLSSATPAWVEDPTWKLKQGRVACTSVLLPDGRVFIAGGIDEGGAKPGGHIEVFDPKTPDQGWRLGPKLAHVRLYHSAMILLRDGSVLIGGENNAVGPFERWFPDYYYLSRPTISNAPASVAWGAAFTIDTPNAPTIGEVVLLRPGAITHGFDQSQRLVELAISGVGAGSVDVQAPPNANVAPPGHYVVFILNGSRVPSVGRWIRLTT